MQDNKKRKNKPDAILITGASSGLGEALASYYAQPDVTLYLSGRNAERLDRVAELCRAKGAQAETALVDVCDRAAMENWITACFEKTPLDLVFANAGISGGTGGTEPGEEGLPEPDEQVRLIFDVNLIGVLNTAHPALSLMQARGAGHVVLMGSMAGIVPLPSAPAYSASKAALRFYGEALSVRYARSGVHVAVVCPGFIKTPMTAVNPFPMPLLMTPEEAVRRIAKGVERKKELIIFPYLLYGLTRMLACLPFFVRRTVFGKLPQKPAI